MARPSEEKYDSFGRIKQIIKEKGITQSELAKKLETSQQQISKMATGKTKITRRMAKMIHELYPEYSYAWLLGVDKCENDDGINKLGYEDVCAVRDMILRKIMENLLLLGQEKNPQKKEMYSCVICNLASAYESIGGEDEQEDEQI